MLAENLLSFLLITILPVRNHDAELQSNLIGKFTVCRYILVRVQATGAVWSPYGDRELTDGRVGGRAGPGPGLQTDVPKAVSTYGHGRFTI